MSLKRTGQLMAAAVLIEGAKRLPKGDPKVAELVKAAGELLGPRPGSSSAAEPKPPKPSET